MGIRIGLVGFGQVGRSIFRLGYNMPGIEFAAVCDSAPSESLVYLLNNSTIEGRFEVQAKLKGNYLVCGKQKVRFLGETEPGLIPWDMIGVDMVIECTGHHRTRAEMKKHLDAGAKCVLLSTPALNEIDATVVRGINCGKMTGKEKLISCGSSSVQALALMLKVLVDAGGIQGATMTTVHAYTGDQQLIDKAQTGLRWSRSACHNIIPNTTWAPGAVENILPEVAGKIKGLALNVPVLAGSNIDLVAKLNKPLDLAAINQAFKNASEGDLKGLLAYTEEPIVSSDSIGETYTVMYDSTATIAMAGGFVKALGWFDNGWAYASRILETAKMWADRREGGK